VVRIGKEDVVVRRIRSLLRGQRVVAYIAAVIVIGGATGAWAATQGSGSGVTTTTSIVAVTTGPLRESVTSTGTVAYASTSNLSFGAAGKVTAVDVAVGTKVTAGQTLATMDSVSLASTVATAQSSVATAQARLSTDSSSSTATATQLAADQAAVTAAQAQLATAQAALAQTTLTSPIDGTVSGVNVAVGDTVGSSGGGAGGGGSANSSSSYAIQVVSTNSFTVTANVDGTQVGQIAVGNQATITPTGSATPAFGTVASISQTASTSSNVSTYPVVISVTGTDSGLHSGASATIAITYRQIANAVQVPVQAIRRDTGGSTYVVVRDGSKDVKTPVTTGVTAGTMIQITRGLSGSEQVVVTVTKLSGSNAPTVRRSELGGTGGFGGATGGTGGFGGFGNRGFGGQTGTGGVTP